MTLSPDEISRRSFTPSADGYHKGEVRAFLERISAQQRAAGGGDASSVPGGPVAATPSPPDTAAAQRHEIDATIAAFSQRLSVLERRLDAAIARIEAAADSRAGASRASDERRRMHDAYVIERPTIAPPTTPRDEIEPPDIASADAPHVPPPPVEGGTDAVSDQPLPFTEPSDPPPMSDPPEPTSVTEPAVPPPIAGDPVAVAGDAASDVWSDPILSTLSPRDLSAGLDDLSAAPEPDAAPTPRIDETRVSASTSELDDLSSSEPLISTRTNDLLDGVLDDVMGNLSERPATP